MAEAFLVKLQKRLEYAADVIEALLVARHCPGRIVGGIVGPRGIRFVLQPSPCTTYEQIRAALPTIPMEQTREGIILTLARDQLPRRCIDVVVS